MIRAVGGAGYADAFGRQWQRYRRTQLDSYTGLPISRTRLRRCVGDAHWGELPDALVLEAGCGAGRFTEVLLGERARVVSVDLSEAVVANAANFPISDRHAVVRADITDLPFEGGQFDFVMCIGVLQHTPDPVRTIAALVAQLRPGGVLVVDQYSRDKVGYASLKPVYRGLLKRLPPGRALPLVERLTALFLPLHAMCAGNRALWFALTRVSPLITYHRDMPELSPAQQREWAALDSHDALTDWYKHPTDAPALRRTLERAGLSDIVVRDGGIGVEARAVRPVAAVAGVQAPR
ncbi:MAG: class I SAM-dependent methyltransferase [Gemmatimonadaceae bacterium]|nr:class I SAM-dependent methyltransferase [Gemmatimonadaceae bacterium]